MFGKAHPGAVLDTSMVQRRFLVEDGRGEDVWFWDTRTGVIVKYSVFLGILLILGLWLTLGRIHAKRRMAAGRKPMSYHAWLLSRQERARVDPAFAWPQAQYAPYAPARGPGGGGPGYGSYGMQPMPPPVYDPSRPPVYEGPPGAGGDHGGSKVDPAQAGFGGAPNVTVQEQPRRDEEYAAPMGPPPAR
ncbi:hypothetical protein GGR56DRAFT_650088 [Xylariaceae sp. FL0804]|nr:hypothetical protein GGR56DRAFT_650088 [Xylariaceae sp. FL0804]